ncbi:MAG: hypothetical protein JO104_11900 [Candidatus Eremiobacteraeota bacterium]|nr:hypothetical protein [Candidatus Eremiobacteraeota bacterium]
MADDNRTPDATGGTPKVEGPPDSAGDKPREAGLAALDHWKRYLVAVAAVLTTLAQLWSIVENQWRLGVVTLLLAAIVVALYSLSHRRSAKSPLTALERRREEVLRLAMIAALIAIPTLSLVGLYAYSYLPRALESGTTIAVARFEGDTLPEPYKECHPSDMLVQTLSRVGYRFGGLRVFELPYSIDPDNRWAEWWAKTHGFFEGADIVVYGEYTLYSSKGSKDPDEIVLDPEVARIPTIPLGFKSAAPLYSWDFPGSVARIAELCSSDLPDATVPRPPRFLDDARRLAQAVVGLQALGKQDYETAREALNAAKQPESSDLQHCESQKDINRDDADAAKSLCPGVLAFYLGMLDGRLGQYDDASKEYTYAARRLDSAAPFINLGELFERRGGGSYSDLATYSFERAIYADPTSVAAIATRAFYDDNPKQAALDLTEAMLLRPRSLYDELVLSRAVYQQQRLYNGDEKDDYVNCGIGILRQLIQSRSLNEDANAAAYAQYGDWQRKKHDNIINDPQKRNVPKAGDEASAALNDAIGALNKALEIDPRNVLANYDLGLIYEHSTNEGDHAAAERYFREAEFAPAFTDDDYVSKANAAVELINAYDGDRFSKKADYNVAMSTYDQSIHFNTGAVYAFNGRANLELENPNFEKGNLKRALADSEKALRLLPYAGLIRNTCEQMEPCKIYENKRFPSPSEASPPPNTWRAITWSAKDCRYRDLDFKV